MTSIFRRAHDSAEQGRMLGLKPARMAAEEVRTFHVRSADGDLSPSFAQAKATESDLTPST